MNDIQAMEMGPYKLGSSVTHSDKHTHTHESKFKDLEMMPPHILYHNTK